jgi:hypothetical protein
MKLDGMRARTAKLFFVFSLLITADALGLLYKVSL